MLNEAIQKLHHSKNICILGHIRPDGDAFGSALGLALALKKLGKNVFCFNQDGLSEAYRFLPGADLISLPPSKKPSLDCLVAVDTSTKERLGETFLSWNCEVDLNLDHHASNTNYARLNLIRADLPATALLIQEIIETAGWPMSAETASNLYVGTSTDTGSFRYRGTTSETFMAVSRLIQAGADPAWLAQKCYQSVPLRKFKLTQLALETAQLELEGRLSHLTLTPEMFRASGALPEDTEGLVESIQEIETVQIAVIFEIQQDGLRVSFRSKGGIDVSEIAAEFGGGGHPLAAGLRMSGDAQISREKILDRLRRAIQGHF